MEETLESLQRKLEQEIQRNKIYENGDAKLYYALQRKMTEMANILNKYNLENVDMASKSDATFERVFKLLEKCETISASTNGLGQVAGVTGSEKKDVEKRPFVDTIADPRK